MFYRYLEAQLASSTEINLANLLLVESLGDYHMPRHVGCNSFPFSHQWIKLRKFCGVFRDETGMCLSKYKGDTEKKENVSADLRSLTFGLKKCKEGNTHKQS